MPEEGKRNLKYKYLIILIIIWTNIGEGFPAGRDLAG
jgi:hypothetical protein